MARPRKIDPATAARAADLVARGVSQKLVAAALDVDRTTLYRALGRDDGVLQHQSRVLQHHRASSAAADVASQEQSAPQHLLAAC